MKNYIYIFLGLLIGAIAYSLIAKENEKKDKKELYEYTGEEFKKQSVNKNNNTELVSSPHKRPVVALANPKIAFLYAKIIMEELAKEKKAKLSYLFKVTLINDSIWKIENYYKKKDVNKKVVLMLKKRDGEVIGYFFEE